MMQSAATSRQGAGPSRDTNNLVDGDLASSIIDKLSQLSSDSLNLNYGTKCIYQLPRTKAEDKYEADYVPRVVSIGFIHHGESQLEDMQEYKLKYVNHFLLTFQVTIEQLAEFIGGQEKLVCECYETSIFRDLSEKYNVKLKPCEVILLDGVFIIVLFLKNHGLVGMGEEGDVILCNPWLLSNVTNDLILFENQLPLGFLKALYNTFVFKQTSDNSVPSFDALVHDYFLNVGSTKNLSLVSDLSKARHFVEFLAILHRPDEKKWYPSVRQQLGMKLDLNEFPSATALKVAGVEFFHGTGLMNVWFDSSKREFTVPQLNLNHSTATFLRNLILFEKSGCQSKHITSYVILLCILTKTRRDVDFLIEKHIIRNEFGSSRQVLGFFQNLYEEFGADSVEFHFVQEEYEQLEAYAHDHVSMFKDLKSDYFSTPSATITLIFLFMGLYISIIQTVVSLTAFMKST